MIFPEESTAPLFSRRHFSDRLREFQDNLPGTVDAIDTQTLLASPVDDLVDYIEGIHTMNIPTLLEDQASLEDPVETSINVKQFGEFIVTKGFIYEVEIPFDGEQEFFELQPSTASIPPPKAKPFQKRIFIRIKAFGEDANSVTKEIRNIIDQIKKNLEQQRLDAKRYHSSLRDAARKLIERRKKALLDAKQIAASIGYPLKRRPDDTLADVIQMRRKDPRPAAPTKTPKNFQPESQIAESEYQHILKVIDNMTKAMERSPSTFNRLGEEALRDFYLVVLNSHYEGNATGETFNYQGKTDILIRAQDRNVFIAECKIWGGKKLHLETIDQILGYLSWRDTKAAIIVFNRNSDFSGVLTAIKTATEEHPHKKHGPLVESETRFRYVFGNPSDHNREIQLTILAFDVPTVAKVGQNQ